MLLLCIHGVNNSTSYSTSFKTFYCWPERFSLPNGVIPGQSA